MRFSGLADGELSEVPCRGYPCAADVEIEPTRLSVQQHHIETVAVLSEDTHSQAASDRQVSSLRQREANVVSHLRRFGRAIGAKVVREAAVEGACGNLTALCYRSGPWRMIT